MTTIKQQAQAALYSFPVNRQQYLVNVLPKDAANWCCDNYEIIRKALTILARDDVVVVPKIPTEEMLIAGDTYARHNNDAAGIWWLRNVFKEMLSAAPDVMEMGDMPNLCNPKNNGE